MVPIIFTGDLIKLFIVGLTIFLSLVLLFTIIFTIIRRLYNERMNRIMKQLATEYDNLINSMRNETVDKEKIRQVVRAKDFPYFLRYLMNKISATESIDVSVERDISDASGFTSILGPSYRIYSTFGHVLNNGPSIFFFR